MIAVAECGEEEFGGLGADQQFPRGVGDGGQPVFEVEFLEFPSGGGFG